MRLLYVHNAIFPEPVGNRYQVMNMCQAFTEEGVDVTLVTSGSDAASILDYYAVRRPFAIECVRPRRQHALRTLQYAARIVTRHSRAHPIYTRDLVLAIALKTLCPARHVIYEVHELLERPDWRALYRHATTLLDGIVAISPAIRDHAQRASYDCTRMLVAPDGVDLERFDVPVARPDARRRLGLPVDKKLVVYVGNTGPDHDLETLNAALDGLPETVAVIFGVEREHLRTQHTVLAGLTRNPEIALKAADVLFFGRNRNCRTIPYMSPLKLFEYMAAQRPIVAADFSSVEEVLSRDGAAFYASGDAQSLREALRQTFNDPQAAALRVRSAFARATQSTWRQRARRILDEMYCARDPSAR